MSDDNTDWLKPPFKCDGCGKWAPEPASALGRDGGKDVAYCDSCAQEMLDDMLAKVGMVAEIAKRPPTTKH